MCRIFGGSAWRGRGLCSSTVGVSFTAQALRFRGALHKPILEQCSEIKHMSLLAARPDADSSSPTSDLRERIRAATSDQRERILELRERQSPQEQSRQRCRFALRHGCPIDGVVSYMLFPFSRPASEPGGKRRITRTAFKRGLAILGSEIRNV